jgi:hypothetical protein
MNASSPYIHSHLENFEIGCSKEVESKIITSINNRFQLIKQKIRRVAQKATELANEQCKALGCANMEEMNAIYRQFLTNKNVGAFGNYLELINEYKHSRMEIINGNTNNQTIDQLQTELIDKLKAKRIPIRLQQQGYTNNLKDYNDLIKHLGTNPALAEIKLGNIAEPIVTEYLAKVFSKQIKGASFEGKSERRNKDTTDIKLTSKDGTEIRFSLKISSTVDKNNNYSDAFSATRGSLGSKMTEYNLERLITDKNYGNIDLIKYVVYNHQILNGTSTITQKVISYLKYIVGWEFILSALFGKGLAQEDKITKEKMLDYPMFLITQDRIITMGEILNIVSNYSIAQASQFASQTPNNYKFSTKLAGRNNSNLLEAKKKDLQSQEKGQPRMSYSELKKGTNTAAALASSYSAIKKNLSFKVHYKIALENIHQLI